MGDPCGPGRFTRTTTFAGQETWPGREFILSLLVALVAWVGAATAHADPVGERHLKTIDATAALRDSEGRDQVRVTVWYPAAAGAKEERIDLGPPGRPLFSVGAVGPDAAFAPAGPWPVILFSHGFGGAARMMGWFGTALARAGYVVVAADHPGNNAVDKMTVAGAVLPWERVDDLRAALAAVEQDPTIAPHLDLSRIGVAGFSAGGFTALASVGARVDVNHLAGLLPREPDRRVCAPQKEFAVTQADAQRALASPPLAAEVAHAGDDHTIPGVRAAFVMAPAIVQALTPES